ncbi:MAG: glucosamine-6-phosphate deaminase [Acidimicrobiales bacterium]
MNPPRRFTVGALHVLVHDDVEALASSAAAQASELITGAVTARGVANVMFATGNSQLAFVETLVGRTPDVPWADVEIFHMDEYVGVGADHPAGFQRWIRERISEKVRPRAAHYIDGAVDPERQCAAYSELLRDHRIDLCCLGIGENGHLAFNDPPVADFDDPEDVKVVELDGACRQQQVNEGHFPDMGSVPARAITVTVPALLRARAVLAMVPEDRKAAPVRAALEGPLTTDCPASVLRTRENAVLHLDRGSASLLSR